MTSSAMELSVFKLPSPRKRLGQSARYTFDNDLAESYSTGDNNSRRIESDMSVDDDMLTWIFEQHCAAVPFKWEATPGTRLHPKSVRVRRPSSISEEESETLKEGTSDFEQDGALTLWDPSVIPMSPRISTSSLGSDLEEDPTTEFQIEPIQPTDDSVSKGHILPLKPPPGMQSIKQLLTLESENRNVNTPSFSSRSVNSLVKNGTCNSASITSSPKSSHLGHSFRLDGLKNLPFFSSAKDQHEDELMNTMLGFEEWTKVVEKQEKQEKKHRHHRTVSMPKLSLPFRKKYTTEKENDGSNSLDVDAIFVEGGLRERSSISSRGLANGYSADFKSLFDDCLFNDSSDFETDSRNLHLDSFEAIEEEDEKAEGQSIAKKVAPDASTQIAVQKEKTKLDTFSRLGRVFRTRSNDVGDYRKPTRLSSVSPAPPPPQALTLTEIKLEKKTAQNKPLCKTSTSSPLLKICLSNSFGQAILKNMRQLRSFEFHTPRALTALTAK